MEPHHEQVASIAPHLTREETDFMAITAPNTLESLTADLCDIASTRRTLTDDLAHLAEREATIRADIHALMQESGIKTADTPYARVQRKQGYRTKVTSEKDLVAAIIERGMSRLINLRTVQVSEWDKSAAKKIGVREEMPGIEQVAYDELAVTLAAAEGGEK